MANGQGEVALLIDINDKGKPSETAAGYALPCQSKFAKEEIRNVYLSAVLSTDELKEKRSGDKNILSSYLCKVYGSPTRKGELNATTVQTVMNSDYKSAEYCKTEIERSLQVQAANMVIQLDKLDYKRDNYTLVGVFAGKKYKPVALKTKPIIGELPAKYRIERHIIGDPLENMPKLNSNPPEFKPTGRYT